MEVTVAGKALIFSMLMGLASFNIVILHVNGEQSPVGRFSGDHYHDQIRKIQALRSSSVRHDSVSLAPSISASPSYAPAQQPPVPIFLVLLTS